MVFYFYNHQTETDVISVEQELAVGSFVDTDESHDSPVNITPSSTAEKAPVFKNPNFVVILKFIIRIYR